MTRTAYSVPEWCKLNGFSRAHFYNLDKIGYLIDLFQQQHAAT